MFRLLEELTCCLLLLCLVQFGNAEPLQPLTDSEADAIVLTQETTKQSAKDARRAELDSATIKSEGRGVLPNGQKVIIREVEPPAVGAQLVETAPELKIVEPLSPTPEQLAQFKSFADKDYQTLMLSATVYDRSVTRLSWRHLSDEFIVFTNADFNYLRGTHSIDAGNTNYSFFMGVGNATYASNPYSDESIPGVSSFSSEHSEYVLAQGNPDNADALAGIEALLHHYDANLPELKIALQRREALAAAKKHYDAQHPEQPEDFVVQFWVPEPANGKAAE